MGSHLDSYFFRELKIVKWFSSRDLLGTDGFCYDVYEPKIIQITNISERDSDIDTKNNHIIQFGLGISYPN